MKELHDALSTEAEESFTFRAAADEGGRIARTSILDRAMAVAIRYKEKGVPDRKAAEDALDVATHEWVQSNKSKMSADGFKNYLAGMIEDKARRRGITIKDVFREYLEEKMK